MTRATPAYARSTSGRTVVAAILPVMFAVCRLHAESLGGLVDRGNAAFAAGKFDEAMSAYDAAAAKAPESPYVRYNKGAVSYRKADYAKARELFLDAGARTKDARLEARSQYNAGNALFGEGAGKRAEDPEKSLSAFEESAAHYQRALELDPGLKDAAHNTEVARMAIKQVREEIKQRQQQEQERQQQQQKAADKLKQLVQRQQQAAGKSKDLSQQAQNAQPQDSQQIQQQANQLAREQKSLEAETKQLAENLDKAESKSGQSPSPVQEAKQKMDKATGEQRDATQKLQQGMPEQAQADQEQAAKDLKEALDALGKKSDATKKEEGKQGSAEEKKEGEDKSQKQEQKQEQQQAGAQEQAEETGSLPEEARDILAEDRQNKEIRDTSGDSGYKPVDKDW